jgi:threonine dehydrogenase-like Zn-dependent dehydrogenase
LPEGVPAARAVLAGTVETAVNALWDAAPLVGDRVTVVGAGMVGCCVARLLRRFPGVHVTLVDVDARRGTVADALGVDFALPDDAGDGRRDSCARVCRFASREPCAALDSAHGGVPALWP